MNSKSNPFKTNPFRARSFKPLDINMQKGTAYHIHLPEGKNVETPVMDFIDPTLEGIEGSRGELIAMSWLKKKNIDFEAQVPILGGRQTRGGRVLDIVISFGNQSLVIRIQSERYHSGSTQLEGDDIQEKVLLMDMGYEVVDVWEERLLEAPDYVMENAIQGIEVGR